MTKSVKDAVDIRQRMVREIHPKLHFKRDGKFWILYFAGQRLGEGRKQEWLRLEPEETRLKASVRVHSETEVNPWLAKIAPPFKPLESEDLVRAKHDRVRFSGTPGAFDDGRAFLTQLFRACVEYAREEYRFIPTTSTAGGEKNYNRRFHYHEISDLDELERTRIAKSRLEQQILRQRVLGGQSEGSCAICGQTYPVSLLVAAHIKRWCECSDSEKRDTANVVPMCLFGCDALFERDYISVRDGRVVSIPGLPATGVVEQRIKELTNRACALWTKENAPYFEWHCANAAKRD